MNLTLEWNNELNEIEIPQQWIDQLQRLLVIAGEQEQVTRGEVSLTFVDDEAIRILNRDYRQLDEPTDVLSFAMNESVEEELDIVYDSLSSLELDSLAEQNELDGTLDEDEQSLWDLPEPLGDIIISLDRAKVQSEQYGHSLEREIGFLFVHGFLHLLGYDHQDDEQETVMFAKQEQILQKAGLTR